VFAPAVTYRGELRRSPSRAVAEPPTLVAAGGPPTRMMDRTGTDGIGTVFAEASVRRQGAGRESEWSTRLAVACPVP